MYIFINDGVGMSRGKIAAQASHAAVEAYRLSTGRPDLLRAWYEGGHYKKLVMRASNSLNLITIERYLNDRDFKTALVIDEGMTEIEPLTPTALGVAVVDKDDPHTAATFSTFETLKPRPQGEEPVLFITDASQGGAPGKQRRRLPWHLLRSTGN